MSYEQTIEIIMVHFPEKTKMWAEYQLERARRNSDCDNYEELLRAEFSIKVN